MSALENQVIDYYKNLELQRLEKKAQRHLKAEKAVKNRPKTAGLMSHR